MTETKIAVQPVSARTKWTYTLGGIGRDMAYALFANFLLTFILFTKHVTEQQFAAISVILIVCRIWDGFNDPIMGGIIESTRSKMGKFKPWILIGVLTNSVILVLMFTLPLQGWTFIIVFGILYLLWDITFTMNDIAYWSMLPSLTSDPKGRATLTSLANLFAGIGAILTIGLTPILTAGPMAIGGNAVTAYAVVVAIIAATFIGCQLMTVFGVKEAPLAAMEKKPKFSFKKMVNIIFKNDQLLWVTACMLLYNLGSALILAFGSIYIYFQFEYNGGLTTVFVAVYAVSSVIVNIGYPYISQKLSRKMQQLISILMVVAGYALFFLFGKNFIAICAALFLISVGQSLYYMVLTISLSNTVEYNQWKSGSRDEGIIFSLRPFMAKMSSALEQLVVMIVYLIAGVTAITNIISDAENEASRGVITEAQKLLNINEALGGVNERMTLILRICMTVIPVVLISASYFLMRYKFKIDEGFYNKILKELAERDNGQQNEA